MLHMPGAPLGSILWLWTSESGFLISRMNVNGAERKRMSVNEYCTDKQKIPQKDETRVNPDAVLRKSMKRIVYDRIHNKTHGGEAREQSLRPNRPEEDGLGRGPAPDVGVMSSWTDGPRDQGPDGSDCASGGQRSTLGSSIHTVPNQHDIESIM